MLDMQAWYVKDKMSTAHLPAERLVNTSYVEEAVKEAWAVQAENPESKLAGMSVSEFMREQIGPIDFSASPRENGTQECKIVRELRTPLRGRK